MDSILIIDDGDAIKQYCDQFLSMSYEFIHVKNWAAANSEIIQKHPSLIILDKVFNIPKEDLLNPVKDKAKEGYSIAKEIKERYPEIPIIMISLYNPPETAEISIDFGIDDFIEWSALEQDRKILKVKIDRLLSKSGGTYISGMKNTFYELGFIGEGKQTMNLMESILEISKNDSNVLILGETGTGKDLIARIIHSISSRSGEPFAEINLSDLPENLVEDEIFGHEKGAFTDAKNEKISKLETAKNGTVLFNEIGDLTKHIQVKLLQLLEKKEFTRIGGVKIITVNCRFIFATNKDLKAMVDNGEFRRDLYYRIKSNPIFLKTLRERVEEIPSLIKFFIKEFNRETGQEKSILCDSIDFIKQKDFPGNIRQLKNLVRNIYDRSDGILTLRDVIKVFKEREQLDVNKQENKNIKDHEKDKILEALSKHDWYVEPACLELGISKATIYRRIKKYGIKDKIKGYSKR